ncbi:Sister chromatid cohesion 1 protein 3 [Platanthera guangdongensis]|uniref:Sister chromatid cohesion 1 protein 3 n=1 Tax=Platanthera guangdongensis TaxID=2320717 RepID=A0ABR2N3C3_9ASPA
MFYSHTFLSRKSPLGTIWMAAHLENKIKRRQIESINIPSSAEKIMMPEVPIALRLSGHLLLGLVRVYSWKANHLFSDCNRLVTDIRKAFASVPDDLPIGADHTPFESVTLPDIVDLNSLVLNESCYKTHEPDKHLKPHDQITMSDHIPMEAEQSIPISVSEVGGLNLSPQPSTGLNLSPQPSTGLNPSSQPTNVLISTPQPTYLNSVSRQLEEDMLPSFERDFESSLSRQENAIFSDNTARENEEIYQNTPDGNTTSQETLDIEKMLCDPHHPSHGVDTPGDIQTGEQSTQRINRRQSLSTIPEDISVPEGGSSDCVEKLVSTSANKLPFPELESFRIPTPALNPERARPVKREIAKKRKRIHAFDKQVILSDKQMKKQASIDCNNSNIIFKRRKLPCSDLSLWKFHMFCRKDDIFSTPLLSGMDARLVEVLQKTYPRSVPNNVTMETPTVEAGTVREAQPASPTFDLFSDIERGRDAENIEDIIPQFSPVNAGGFGSEFIKGNISEIRSSPTVEITPPVEPVLHNLETPPFHLTELNLDDMVIPEAPGLLDSADKDLSFLNENDSSPGHNDAFLVENMSGRTRAVAKYFKDNAVEAQSDESGHISLNKILEQKNRKQCSRMFFETLVLKSCDFIRVEQTEAYGDILVSPTPALLCSKF